MSVKIKDVITVFRQNKVDKALGLLEPLSRHRPEDSIKSSSNESSSWTRNQPSECHSSPNSSTSSYVWGHNNIARAEEGTTFYFRQKIQ